MNNQQTIQPVNTETGYEYIVVGSGAGGGTLAARLAENGRRVLLLESGGDPLKLRGGNAISDENRLPEDYEVPVFHALSSENEAIRWDYFVRHYSDDEQQLKDPKYVAEFRGEQVDGVLYPRAGCLGGCTAHNAMIMVYPHNEDWDHIARITGDDSWQSGKMRDYFHKLENCRHRPVWRFLARAFGFNPSRHGFNGWLSTEAAIPKSALGDGDLVETVADSVVTAFKKMGAPLKRSGWLFSGLGDPNDWRLVRENSWGLRYPPLSTHKHRRMGTRERLLAVQEKFPGFLTITLDACVSRVLLDENNRATGVEYLQGARLYRAHSKPRNSSFETRVARASKEVILSCGAFNTPQLLMLSGIGPREELEKHGIPLRVHLPGVGKNLQDRYEVGVVNRMADDWEALQGAKYSKGDPLYRQWARHRKGVYTSNGAVLAVIKRSLKERKLPDLFCFALLGLFRGYFPGYSKLVTQKLNYLTWAILKAHTNNCGGYVKLRSADPLDTPEINFRYFEEGTDSGGEDLQSVVEAVRFIRELTAPLREEGLILEEELPGESVQTDEEIAQFVRNAAWGHHASCTCPIGDPEDEMSVLDSRFRVKGTRGLRVVDASVFPRIPGFFIVSAIYMIGEKAAVEILRDSGDFGREYESDDSESIRRERREAETAVD